MTRIDLAKLVPADKLEHITCRERDGDIISTSKVRGVELRFLTQTQRQLWQAVGHEYIEPELLDFIDDIPVGSVFYDIGASNGIFSHYAAAKGLDVYAFEADAQNFALLDYNNYLNGGRVHCFNLAISRSLSLGHLYSAKFEAAGHMKILDRPQYVGGGDFLPEYVSSVMKYPLSRWIRDFGAPQPQFLKIDVDGAEYEVLTGAEESLENVRGIFIEISKHTPNAPAITELLKSSGFELHQEVQVQHYNDLHNCIFLKR